MAWSFEFKTGLGWALLITILMIVAIWVEIAIDSLLPLLLPVVVYIGFLGWVFRIKK